MVIIGALLGIALFMAALAGLVYIGSSQGRPPRPVDGFPIADDYPPKPLDQ